MQFFDSRTRQRSDRLWGVSYLPLVVCLALVVSVATGARAQYVKKSAGIGALLGLALGDGNIIEDVAAGAALGAAGGGIANMATDGKRKKRQREADRIRAEEQYREDQRDAYMKDRERQLADQERRLSEMELSQRERELLEREQWVAEQERRRSQATYQVAEAISEREQAEAAIIQAIGPDAWEGYKALRGCQHDRSIALAGVSATSQDRYFQLAALWLEAMARVDARQSQQANAVFEQIVEADDEIDTVQQASLATDQAVLDMRSERREIGIVCQ